MRLIDAEPIERKLFRLADKALAKNPYENAKICAFRRAFELILNAPTIASSPNALPPNDPLTLNELREMDGEPIWVVRGEWVLIRFVNNYGIGTHGYGFLGFEDWRVDWWAYRRKPEEGTE